MKRQCECVVPPGACSLHAAAHDLLDAGLEIIRLVDEVAVETMVSRSPATLRAALQARKEAVAKLRVAIAKAKGEEP